MNARRTLATASAALLLLASLTACFGIPTIGTGGGTTTTNDISGTTWTGTDSDGDTWSLEFQADHTIGLQYDAGAKFDDTTDVWAQSGTGVTVHVEFTDGNIDLAGVYDGTSSMTMNGTFTGGQFTLPLVKS